MLKPALAMAGILCGPLAQAGMPVPMGGEMVYRADAALFTECASGNRVPMAMEQDYLAAERAYRARRAAPGAPVYVTLEGEIAERPKMEGAGTEPALVVHRFINAWPTERCARARADAALENTYWKIVRIGGESVPAVDGAREAHMVLKPADGAPVLSATAGCNRINARYGLDGATLRVMPGPMTRMACPPPLDAAEQRLVALLSRIAGWRVIGNTLELFDADGAPLADLIAVALP